jgi:hypothetical protein
MVMVAEGRLRSGLELATDSTAKEVQAFFKASTYTRLGDDRTTLFWEDQWIDGQDSAIIAPYLHQRIPQRVRRKLTVREGCKVLSFSGASRCLRSQTTCICGQWLMAYGSVTSPTGRSGDGQHTEHTLLNLHIQCCTAARSRWLGTCLSRRPRHHYGLRSLFGWLSNGGIGLVIGG